MDAAGANCRSSGFFTLPSGRLLQQLNAVRPPGEADLSGPVPTTEQLEKQFSLIVQNQERVNELKTHAATAAAAKNAATVKRDLEEAKPLVSLLNLREAAFERDLAAARQARPKDTAVQWLTGELLITVGGEPEQILPYLHNAALSGMKQPQLFASLAKVEFDLNRFEAAYDHALQAVEQDRHSRAAWDSYGRASFALERFGEVIQRLDQAFPNAPPVWASAMRSAAQRLSASWSRELALRRSEDKAGTLPQVRLIVEHRKFLGAVDGKQSAPVESTGRGEVIIQLFEDQAPATVANFISLVEAGFYNGTSFYWAEGGHMVVGGDPNTKNDDPSDDGIGGPGYVIPDEFSAPQARPHFRGTISTVQNGPRKAGSQFVITLVPSPEFDGNSTAFGRVIQGQKVLDQVAVGRTNREVGQFGKIIPGDLVVRAEAVRKRPHAYPVTKLTP